MVRLLDSAVVQSEIRGKFYFCEANWFGVLFLFGCRSPSCRHLSVERSGALFVIPSIVRILPHFFFTDSTKTTVVNRREGPSLFGLLVTSDLTWMGTDDPFDRFDAGS